MGWVWCEAKLQITLFEVTANGIYLIKTHFLSISSYISCSAMSEEQAPVVFVVVLVVFVCVWGGGKTKQSTKSGHTVKNGSHKVLCVLTGRREIDR